MQDKLKGAFEGRKIPFHCRLGEVCSHAASILFKIEVAVKLGLTTTSSTSEACQWNKTFREKVSFLLVIILFYYLVVT